MPRAKNTVPTLQLNVAIPTDLMAKLELFLYSEVEGKVPHGAKSELIVNLLRNHFTRYEGGNHAG